MDQETAEDAREVAFTTAYESHHATVYRICLRYGGGRVAWAEDAAHDVFIKLIETLDRLDRAGEVGGWLYRVTANVCISRLRREKSFLARLLALEPPPTFAPPVDAKDDAEAAAATLASLPPRERVVLSMKVIDGKSQHEIATTLGLSEGYVSKLLKSAWKYVREAGWEAPDEP